MEGRISAASSPLPMSNPYSPKYERNVTALRVFAIRSHLVAWISGCGRTEPDPCSGSYDADVLRASQLQHSVQHVGRDGHVWTIASVQGKNGGAATWSGVVMCPASNDAVRRLVASIARLGGVG